MMIEGVTVKQGKAERVFLYFTAPLRRILSTAFTVFFLPPKSNSNNNNNNNCSSTITARNLCRAIKDKKQHRKRTSEEKKSKVCSANGKQTTKSEEEKDDAVLLEDNDIDKGEESVVSHNSVPEQPIQQEEESRSSERGSSENAANAGNNDANEPIVQPRRRVSLFKLFLEHPSGREFIWVCVPLKLLEDAFSIVAPSVVRMLVVYLREVSMPKQVRNVTRELLQGLGICTLLTFVLLGQSVVFQYYLKHLYGCAFKAGSALKTLILHHNLEMPMAYLQVSTNTQPANDAGDAKSKTDMNSENNKTESVTNTLQKNQVEKEKSTTRFAFFGSPLSESLNRLASPFARRRQSSEEVPLRKNNLSENTNTNKNTSSSENKTGKSNTASLSREGEIVSLVSVDTTACAECLIFLHNV